MPRIFDNIQLPLLPALRSTLQVSERADFCVGYFNLRGWKHVDTLVEKWAGGPGACCRLLVGMQELPQEELRHALSLLGASAGSSIDNQTALRLKNRMAQQFREQLTLGAPSNQDEEVLRRLSAQIRSCKVVVKLFLRHHLHAKLYLSYRQDPNNPKTGFVGSSNLTLAGLSKQGELNVDVLDQDACDKIATWFEDRWNDRFCLDISLELADIIDASWAREQPIPPYHVYLKMAYHLSQEARDGLTRFGIPHDFGNRLFDFQAAAVKMAAQYLKKRNGVLIGDVVGLGKTLMASALARILQDQQFLETLIICPKNVERMWQDYVDRYRMIAKVLPLSRVLHELPDLRRYRVVLIDESHNLRNREGRRFKVIQDYIGRNAQYTILLSATPYNKNYLDLAAQLRLFLPEDQELGVRPERRIAELGETEFRRQYQCKLNSLAAFEKSSYPDDWRDLMRHYMVRRTRGFIKKHYAIPDEVTDRKYLLLEDGSRSYFPIRQPKTVTFSVDESDPSDTYARLYADSVVEAINALRLPRYGLGNYVGAIRKTSPSTAELRELENLSKAGIRLMGFCRTNLFKRLESGGDAFLQSLRRHVLRNFLYLHAIEQGEDLPIGTQDAELLDTRVADEDPDAESPQLDLDDEDEDDGEEPPPGDRNSSPISTEGQYRALAGAIYPRYAGPHKRKFKWLRPALFDPALAADLLSDARALLDVLHSAGDWRAGKDAKLDALTDLLVGTHPDEKVLIFTQFADTARYLEGELHRRGVRALAGVTGTSADPTNLAWRFSPDSNGKRDIVSPQDELRVLVTTDVLSEGQNLQDCAIIVNYDLPWAIIRLIQRAGRVDRIGQKAQTILCYSFLPADGVERIIRLRGRVRKRLLENAEVVGTDEEFFEGEDSIASVLDIYNEQAGSLDGEADTEVDLASYAYQIWKNATDKDPSLKKAIGDLANVVYATRDHPVSTATAPEGVLLYMRTADDSDQLAWIDTHGDSVTQSQLAILDAAACSPNTAALPRDDRHHDLVKMGVEAIVEQEQAIGGQLGRPSGARFRTYERLKRYAELNSGKLFAHADLQKAIDDVYRYPLQATAVDALNRQLRLTNADDESLLNLVLALRDQDRLSRVDSDAEEEKSEPQIICSLGLFTKRGGGRNGY